MFRLPLAKTKEEKKSSFPLWGNRKEKNQRKKLKEGKQNTKKNKGEGKKKILVRGKATNKLCKAKFG